MASSDQTERQESRALPGVGFVVTVASGGEVGRTFVVDPERPTPVLMGKSPLCDLVLLDPMVSRRHASLEVRDCRLVLTDLDSMNGTYANGVAISSAYLEGGETIRVGGVSLRVDVAPAAGVSAPSQSSFGRLVGQSPRMRMLYTLCERLAMSDVPIVVEGESGTGKELVAECIHECGVRAAGPFVVFDAGAAPRASFEVTLFGERGAGGQPGQPGLFELAHGGTLFIDAVDEIEVETQAKCLRAIERGEILPVADNSWRRVNVRVIAATSKNLESLVEARRFREDLFFRLAVGRLEVPPLRRRERDVLLLARHFFQRHSGSEQQIDEFLARHAGYDWPGNVRELENTIARFAAMGDVANLAPTRAPRGAPSRPTAVSAAPPSDSDFIQHVVGLDLSYAESRSRILELFERLYVERVLSLHNGNVSRAAAASGLARRYFQKLRSKRR
jgi:DNA-binding NtrC family response regulator